MPIVPGNNPKPAKKSSGFPFGLIVFLLVFGGQIYNVVRSATRGIITDQQLMIVAGGAVALVVLAVIVQRVNRSRQGSTMYTPTYTPSSNPTASLKQYTTSGSPSLPSAPRFEPVITGKVVLAGLILALLLGGIGFVVLVGLATP
ncbi:MAG TPA: hypothetical protein VGD69_08125 [Herpetosiphonaceae bacterium]